MFQLSGQKELGEGSNSFPINRDGSAEIGVSILLLLLYACAFWEPGFTGIGGRAKGFGGPWAPALRRALALGEGGGRTTPEEWEASVLVLAGVSPGASPLAWGEEPAVPLPPSSDCSEGIWTFRRGRLAPEPSPASEEMDWFRWGCGITRGVRADGGTGAVLVRLILPMSTDWGRWVSFSVFIVSLRGSVVVVPIPQCCANKERLSSIGVNMLRDFAGCIGFG